MEVFWLPHFHYSGVITPTLRVAWDELFSPSLLLLMLHQLCFPDLVDSHLQQLLEHTQSEELPQEIPRVQTQLVMWVPYSTLQFWHIYTLWRPSMIVFYAHFMCLVKKLDFYIFLGGSDREKMHQASAGFSRDLLAL